MVDSKENYKFDLGVKGLRDLTDILCKNRITMWTLPITRKFPPTVPIVVCMVDMGLRARFGQVIMLCYKERKRTFPPTVPLSTQECK